jgi:MoxR-like ATPase
MIKLSIGYPSKEDEAEILKRRTERRHDEVDLRAVIDPATFLAMRAAVEEVYVDPDVQRYIVEMVTASRRHGQVMVGASPRGSLALLKLGRARAALLGRDYVIPDDIKVFTQPALVHRLILQPSLWGMPRTENNIVTEVVGSIPVPVIQEEHA